jgi:hypothetical protein
VYQLSRDQDVAFFNYNESCMVPSVLPHPGDAAVGSSSMHR